MLLLPVLWLLHAAQPPRPSPSAGMPAAAPGTILVGMPGTAERTVPLLLQRDGADAHEYARGDQLATALGGTLAEESPGRWRLRVAGSALVLREGVPFAVVGEGAAARELPLAVAAFVEGERLWVPLQLASDLLPRIAADLAFDAERRALTLSRRGTRPERPAVVRAPAPTPPPPSDSGPGTVRLPSIIGPRRAPDAPTADVPSDDGPGRTDPGGSLARRTIVVDAGHGGPDGGMSGPIGGGQLSEKRVTLAVALALRASLRTRGVGVVMTRTTDTLIALADRGRIANQRGGDLFISIHVNAANPSWRDPAATRGFETYILSEAKTEDDRRVADLENQSVRFETAARTGRVDPLDFIMRDMAQNEHLRESSNLASLVEQRLGRVHPGRSRGVKQAGFRVLVSAFMPAVLVEIGFGSNPAEAAWMASADGQRQIAESVADAAVEYLRRYERRVRPAARP